MGTSISITILVLYIYPASILFLYQHINYSATIYLFELITTMTDQLSVISLVKVKKSKVNDTVSIVLILLKWVWALSVGA